MNATRKILTPIAAALLQQALQSKPHSLDDLAVVSGLSKPLVRRYVRELHEAEPHMVFVAAWAPDPRGYATIRKFKWGNKPDVARPATSRTAAERMRSLRAERKNGGAA